MSDKDKKFIPVKTVPTQQPSYPGEWEKTEYTPPKRERDRDKN
jgi:hypothetical protein